MQAILQGPAILVWPLASLIGCTTQHISPNLFAYLWQVSWHWLVPTESLSFTLVVQSQIFCDKSCHIHCIAYYSCVMQKALQVLWTFASSWHVSAQWAKASYSKLITRHSLVSHSQEEESGCFWKCIKNTINTLRLFFFSCAKPYLSTAAGATQSTGIANNRQYKVVGTEGNDCIPSNV